MLQTDYDLARAGHHRDCPSPQRRRGGSRLQVWQIHWTQAELCAVLGVWGR